MGRKREIIWAVIISLSLCWFIGQQIKMVNEERQAQAEEKVDDAHNAQDSSNFVETVISQTWEKVFFEGNQETEDNPWGNTACWFDMDGEGRCILLNPNTSIRLGNVKGKSVAFEYRIHPWVNELSDGSGLRVCIVNMQNDILDEKEIAINKDDGWQLFQLDLSGFDGDVHIDISCNNGGNGNDDGDWVVIKPSE